MKKNAFLISIVLLLDTMLAGAQAMEYKGLLIGVSVGRPIILAHHNESPSNFSQLFLGSRFIWKKSIFAITPRLSVQRSLVTSSYYFERSGSGYYFSEAPGVYQNNRLLTYAATIGLGVSVHKGVTHGLELELMMEPQVGKNVYNGQLYTKDGEAYKSTVSNNPVVYGGEITLWLKKKCPCGGMLFAGPGILLQNGSYIQEGAFRSITPVFSLAMQL